MRTFLRAVRPRHNPAPCQGGVDNRPVVVALHCSGADGSQWRKLAGAGA